MISDKKIDYMIYTIEKSGQSYDTIAAGCGLSKATISRLVTKRLTSAYTLNELVAYFGIREKWDQLTQEEKTNLCPLPNDIRREMQKIEQIYAEREARLETQFAERVSALQVQYDMMKDQYELLRTEHAAALSHRDDLFNRTSTYLKHQVAKKEEENEALTTRALTAEARITALNEAHDLHCRSIHRRYRVLSWGCILVVCVALVLGWFIPPPFVY